MRQSCDDEGVRPINMMTYDEQIKELDLLGLHLLAAKACGLSTLSYDGVDYDGSLGIVLVDEVGRHLCAWSPLRSLADAATTEANLELPTDWFGDCVQVLWPHPDGGVGSCKVAFTRPATEYQRLAAKQLAILRAAAKIGATKCPPFTKTW